MSSKIFTSYLNVNDFLLAKAGNYKVIKAIQSVSQKKIAYFGSKSWNLYNKNYNVSNSDELKYYEKAFSEAFNKNIADLKLKAIECGANTIVDVKVDVKWLDSRTLRLSVLANAAFYNEFKLDNINDIYLSNLNLIDTYNLIRNNYLPKKIIFVYSNSIIRRHCFFPNQYRTNNIELSISSDFSRLIQSNIDKLYEAANNQNIEGLVGVQYSINHDYYTYPQQSLMNIILSIQIIGTGVSSLNHAKQLAVTPSINLN